jgi:hypothetical protein
MQRRISGKNFPKSDKRRDGESNAKLEFHCHFSDIPSDTNNRSMGFMAAFVKNTFFVALFLFLCGCTTTKSLKLDLPKEEQHQYYVIDINADIPDANFDTFEEASVYQKEFAEYHDYVIVKADEQFSVYNMEVIKNER